MVSPSFSRKGKRAVRSADRMAGKGGWSKRKLLCNAADKDDLVLHESGLTSIWCLGTKTTEESVQRVLQMSVACSTGATFPGRESTFVQYRAASMFLMLTGPSNGL